LIGQPYQENSNYVGARPQFLKAAAISQAIRETGELWELLIHTGQHYDAKLSASFFDELEIPSPHYNLGVGSGGHGHQTGEIMKRIEPVLLDERPDLIMVTPSRHYPPHWGCPQN
jgi:UDP-GlcNAc3NAcA epimerase